MHRRDYDPLKVESVSRHLCLSGKYGLQHGVDGPEARHISTQQYFREIKQLTGELIEGCGGVAGAKRNGTVRILTGKEGVLYMEYLCCLIGFNNSKTATLVKGKPLEYEGEIYSEEHKRGLMTEGAGLQIVKDRLTGQSVLSISRKPKG